MIPRGVLLDSNLFILLVIGAVDRSLVGVHPRISSYSLRHFDLLIDFISDRGRVLTVAHVLAETSNLLGTHDQRFGNRFRITVEECIELPVTSLDAIRRSEFRRLGLTDSVLLTLASPDAHLLTADGPLYEAALRLDPRCASLLAPIKNPG